MNVRIFFFLYVNLEISFYEDQFSRAYLVFRQGVSKCTAFLSYLMLLFFRQRLKVKKKQGAHALY